MKGKSVTTRWATTDVACIADAPIPEIPLIVAADATSVLPGVDLWDMWPVCLADGNTAKFVGRTLWMILSAPVDSNPDLRHDIARIRFLAHDGVTWHDLGNLLPDGFAPGTREWAGSAVFDPAGDMLTLYFTSTGRRGEPFSFEQRMFETRTSLALTDTGVTLGDWSPAIELFASDGDIYVDTRRTEGGPGMIKGFRDPGYFRDPRDGREFMVFTGSDGRSAHSHNGVIGIAEKIDGSWTLHAPLLSGDGVNNEFERPHLIHRDDRYYLFWSTQRHVFAPDEPSGPNGLYGMVADRIEGPYRLLNNTGLVAANPASEPMQSYSWLVLASLDVVSFIDLWGMMGRKAADVPGLVRRQFGGTPAPIFRIALNGDRSAIIVSSNS